MISAGRGDSQTANGTDFYRKFPAPRPASNRTRLARARPETLEALTLAWRQQTTPGGEGGQQALSSGAEDVGLELGPTVSSSVARFPLSKTAMRRFNSFLRDELRAPTWSATSQGLTIRVGAIAHSIISAQYSLRI